MNYKIQGAIRKNKKAIIISTILWLFLIIVFVVPLAFSIYAATLKGTFDMGRFIDMFRKIYNTAV